MGRQKLRKTPEQIAEQKRRWWGPSWNERRARRRATDSAYREKVKSSNRASYRRRSKCQQRNCRDNIPKLHEFGSFRIVVIDGARRRLLTLSVPELAKALGYHPVVFNRWQKEGKFPPPAVSASDGKVYTRDQARRLLTIISEHQDRKLYFNKSDAQVIRQLFKAMGPINRG